jgi:hypothetical protein
MQTKVHANVEQTVETSEFRLRTDQNVSAVENKRGMFAAFGITGLAVSLPTAAFVILDMHRYGFAHNPKMVIPAVFSMAITGGSVALFVMRHRLLRK